MSRRTRPAGAVKGLQALRFRLTAVYITATTIVLVLFVLLLLITSTRLERERLDSDLTGAALRATALIYDDEETGRTRLDGITDDDLATSGHPLLVADRDAKGAVQVLLAIGSPDRPSALALARRAAEGAVDRPVFGTVGVAGEPRRAAGLAWWHDDGRRGGSVVVVASETIRLGTNRLLLPAAGGGAAVLVLLATLSWLIAGRSLRPAATALADRERFLSTAAHELRGPVARLRAGAEAVRRSVPAGHPAAPALNQLVTVADSAAHVVSNLLLATRAEHGDIPVRHRPVDLATLAGELEHAYPSVLVDVVEPVVVDGDPALLRHALNNLVDNAVRHGRVGDALPSVDVSVRRVHDQAVIRVSDDGPGFPPDVDVLARYSVGASGGTGLGLPLVAWIVAQHRGRLDLDGGGIDARSGVSLGAAVELRLPLAVADRAAALGGQGRDAGRTGTRGRADGQVAMSTKRE